MNNDSMIYGGFDLTFIDIDVKPLDSKSHQLIETFPPFRSHHTNTEVKLFPGGNGFNLCRTLATLGREVTFVGPSSSFYEKLVDQNNIDVNIFPIEGVDVNYTIIVNSLKGEIQFNSINNNLSTEHLNDELIEIYRRSSLKSISNIALNPTSMDWISSLLLSLFDRNMCIEELKNLSFEEKLNSFSSTSIDGILFIDPSDISSFKNMNQFAQILKKVKLLEGEKYLSVNEYELEVLLSFFGKSPQEFAKKLEFPIILHTANFVKFFGKEYLELQTKKPEKKTTFVGAGDCFNGSFLHSILDSFSVYDSLKCAIESATYLIETGFYPTENVIKDI